MNTPFYATDSDLTVFLNGTPYRMGSSHRNFNTVRTKLLDGTFDWAVDEPLFAADVPTIHAPDGTITLNEGYVTLRTSDGSSFHLNGTIVDRLRTSPPATTRHLTAFLQRCAANPRPTAIMELYEFLDATRLPITADGHFLAYKKVRSDGYDLYTGTYRNLPGDVVTMARANVDPDRDSTCSTGLHFAGYDYMSAYGTASSNIIVTVKIDPADVVAIPSDYNNQKGRCCRYEVISIHEDTRLEDTPWIDDPGDDDDDYDFYTDTEDDDDGTEEYDV